MYDSMSANYDRFVNWGKRLNAEMPFLEGQLQFVIDSNRATKVLDAACGTGMHAIALSNRGFKAAGADYSAGMVEKAAQNAQMAGADVEFRRAGFGELSRFFADQDCVLCLGNSLPHISGPTMLLTTLQDFGACLRDGGLLVIQNRNFDAVLTKRERWMEPEAQNSETGEFLFVRFYDFDPDGLITFHVITLSRKDDQAWQQQVGQTRLYPLREREIVSALQRAGFGEIVLYGGLAPIPFEKSTSGNLVVTARWRPGKNDHF